MSTFWEDLADVNATDLLPLHMQADDAEEEFPDGSKIDEVIEEPEDDDENLEDLEDEDDEEDPKDPDSLNN